MNLFICLCWLFNLTLEKVLRNTEVTRNGTIFTECCSIWSVQKTSILLVEMNKVRAQQPLGFGRKCKISGIECQLSKNKIHNKSIKDT